MTTMASVMSQKLILMTRFTRAAEGQDLLEYAMLMALIAIFAMAAVSAVGQTINTVFWTTIANNF